MSPSQPSPRAIYREPLLHFLVLGGLIFGLDQLAVSRKPDPHVIVVGPEVEREARAIFSRAQGREPTPAELLVLRKRWIDNEVLYREGLALRLEQGDETLRERIIFKALNTIESSLRVPSADEATLRAYFEEHRAAYDTEAAYDFEEALIQGGKADEDTARRFAQALNEGAQADIESGLRVFKNRPRNTIVASFGPALAARLDQLPLARWEVLDSQDGPRVIRLEARSAAERARFEDVSGEVRRDWQDRQAQQQRTAALRELSKKYTVRTTGESS